MTGKTHLDIPLEFPFTPMRGVNHESYTLGAGVVSVHIPLGAKEIMMQAITQNIRFTLDGTNPTATSGFQLATGQAPTTIPISTTTVLKIIREQSGAILQYQFGE